jgi:hypothetical protein
MSQTRTKLGEIRKHYEGHRHDEYISLGLLLLLLDLMEEMMDEQEAVTKATEDTNTLLSSLHTGLQDLLDEVKTLQGLIPDPSTGQKVVEAVEALDAKVQAGTAEVQADDPGSQTPPAEEKPAEEPPKEEPPAEEKPAEEPPVEEKPAGE